VKKQAWLILFIITLIAGLALAATNMVTAGPIEEQRVKAVLAARSAVFPVADSFEEVALDANSSFDSIVEAKSGTDLIGYVIQLTVSGYAGPIVIILGVDTEGMITGLSVGGSKFAETAGLGTRVKLPSFTDQFVGLAETPTLNGNVDTISGATISSSAVINGVIKCYQEWRTVSGGDSASLLPAAAPSL
jgi:Na+-translocating ferredoxin:NAD+ oxidoreductase subunit G